MTNPGKEISTDKCGCNQPMVDHDVLLLFNLRSNHSCKIVEENDLPNRCTYKMQQFGHWLLMLCQIEWVKRAESRIFLVSFIVGI